MLRREIGVGPDRRQRVQSVALEALALAANERAAYLEAACAGDGHLRRDVDSLLAGQAQAAALFDTPPWATPCVPLAPGTRLGPYEVGAAIGAGGMGDVYKATDTRLGRTVAIKVLPPGLASDPERRARFQREAKIIAALSHPHICPLHDVGEHDGVTFLVMEHLAGGTLAERLRRGRLPIAEALRVAIDIADALSAAHRQGIVHRDLKPGNVMLTKSGATLLDFGLAKLTRREAATAGAQPPPSAPGFTPLTGKGLLVGTLPYIAPEQIEGREADGRADIWAFGCVLYEMLTGHRLFGGTSEAAQVGAILRDDPPPVSSLLPGAPLRLDRVVQSCLAKDPDARWDSAHDVADELRWIVDAARSGEPLRSSRSSWSRRRPLVFGAVGALAVIAVVASAIQFVTFRPSPQPVVSFQLSGSRPASYPEPKRSFAISRDGLTVAFVTESGGVRRLRLRKLEAQQESDVAGTDGAQLPFFSPDGTRIGFFADGRLKVIPIGAGGAVAMAIAIAPTPYGATWTRDDRIIYTPNGMTGLWEVPAGGGPARELVRPDVAAHERSYRWPEILPDDDGVLFTLVPADIESMDDQRVMVRSRSTGDQREVLARGMSPMYEETGHLLYVRAGSIYAMPFDSRRRASAGSAVEVLKAVAHNPINGGAEYAISRNGTLVYIAGGPTVPAAVLTWVDRRGAAVPVDAAPAPYQAVSLSRDGRRAAVDIDAANAGIWTLDPNGSSPPTRLTLEWSCNAPIWTPDGSHVVFTSARGGVGHLWSVSLDGSHNPEILVSTADSASIIATSWSPGGRVLAFNKQSPETGYDVWTIDVAGDRKPVPFLKTAFLERNARFSPVGRLIAYMSNETGRDEIYVQPFSGPGMKQRVSKDGGRLPVWARDGRELFYRNGDAMMAVTIPAGAELPPGPPRELFRLRSPYSYDVAPDGRFLMIESQTPTVTSSPITVVLNWFEGLKAKVPVK